MNEHAGIKLVFEILRDIGEMAGWLAAAAYFIYKVGSGYLISGLSLKMKSRRILIRGHSYVAVTLVAKKGNIGTIQLHDAMIVIRNVLTGAAIGLPERFKNLNRWSCDPRKSPLQIDPGKISITSPLLNFAPGDEMQFAGVAKLPDDDVYLIEAIILGKRVVAWTRFLPDWMDGLKKYIQSRQNFFAGQWRTVCVLGPESKPVTATTAIPPAGKVATDQKSC